MSDFKERLHLEIEDLNTKIEGLNRFFSSAGYLNLSQANQTLLRLQSDAMMKYYEILQIRIELIG